MRKSKRAVGVVENGTKVSNNTANLSVEFYKSFFQKFKNVKFSTSYIAKIAILTAISFILYAFVKFNLPFMFPSFLDVQISELPALLAGFSMGPISASLVIILKCLFKFAMSKTFLVGEATDILMGLALVLPASIIYGLKKDKKHAFIGLLVGSLTFCAAGLIVNRYISIPFYVNLYFGGNFGAIVEMLRPLYKNITEKTFYAYYLGVGVLPFNLIRCIIISLLTFLLYKRLSVILHWEGTALKSSSIFGKHVVKSEKQTYALAKKLASTLQGGEVLLLNGELGAGKTTFTKGLASSLGVKEDVSSPTFTILNVYESGRLKLNHLDMYRVESADELQELGLDGYFDGDAVTVIEWNKFEHVEGKVIDISITVDGKKRIFEITNKAPANADSNDVNDDYENDLTGESEIVPQKDEEMLKGENDNLEEVSDLTEISDETSAYSCHSEGVTTPEESCSDSLYM